MWALRNISEPAWRAILSVLAVVHLLTATWAVADHGSFADRLAPFGPLNGHLIDDYAAASATIGGAFVLAAINRTWRVPLLAIALTWTALHTASHIVAADQAMHEATGLAEAGLLAGSTLLLGLLLRAAMMQSTRSDDSRRETASTR